MRGRHGEDRTFHLCKVEVEIDGSGMSDVEDTIGLGREPGHHLSHMWWEQESHILLVDLVDCCSNARGLIHTLPPVSFKCCCNRSMVLSVTTYPSVRWFSPEGLGGM